MELINKQYIRLNEYEIFLEIVKASDEHNNEKVNFFEKLLETFMNYKKANRIHNIGYIYISINDLIHKDNLNIESIPITRETIMNAALYALYNNDVDIASRLSKFFERRETIPYELGELSDYVLTYGIDMSEYFNNKLFNRPSTHIIYNEIKNKLEEGYIYQEDIIHKTKKLKQ